jgi:hypothetical protein
LQDNDLLERYKEWKHNELKCPHPHSFAKNKNISMESVMETGNNLYDLFHLLLSIFTHNEIHDLKNAINSMVTSQLHVEHENSYGVVS